MMKFNDCNIIGKKEQAEMTLSEVKHCQGLNGNFIRCT